MKDLWKIKCDENKGVYLRFASGVNSDLRKEIQYFLRWVRKHYYFPKKLNIFISDEEYVYTFNTNEQVSASIFIPDSEKQNPLIRVSTGDYSTTLRDDGHFTAVCSILASIAHELTHYYQWLKDNNSSFSEKQASRKSVKVVYKYIDDSKRLNDMQ